MLKVAGTGLSNLDFMDPGFNGTHSWSSLNISGNPNLTNIDIQNYSLDYAFISGNGISTSVSLMNLQEVGSLEISAVTGVVIWSLAEVSNLLSIADSSITQLDLYKLKTLGTLSITNNTFLRRLSVPVAIIGHRYGGKSDVQILDNPGLFEVDFNTVEHIYGDMVIKNNPILTHIGLNNLSSCNMVDVSGSFSKYVDSA